MSEVVESKGPDEEAKDFELEVEEEQPKKWGFMARWGFPATFITV